MSDFTTSARPELEAAALFLSSYLPSLHTSSFTSSLVRQLTLRYSGHWYPANPEKGSAYRAIVRSGSSVDQSLLLAAKDAGIDRELLLTSLEEVVNGEGAEGTAVTATTRKLKLSSQWTLWVDPGLVLLRLDSSSPSFKGCVGLCEGQFVTIYGSIQPELSLQSLSLTQVLAPSYSSPPAVSAVAPSTMSPTPLEEFTSPNKRSKAIQILRPPTRTVSASFTQPALPSPPTVTPPTPLRPSTTTLADVFSSEDSSPPPPLPLLRPSSRGSFSSSSSSSSSDDDATSNGSTASSALSTLWPPALSPTVKMDGEFKYPPLPQHLPSRPSSALSSHSSYTFPSRPAMTSNNSYGSRPTSAMSNHSTSSSTSSSYFGSQGSHANHQRAPSSPSKPRRRGTRGSGSSSSHSSQPSLDLGSASASSSISISSTHPTREQAAAGVLKEYSGAKVGVLGGGVLLGLSGAKAMGDARGNEVGEARRRGRERRRGGSKTQPIAVY